MKNVAIVLLIQCWPGDIKGMAQVFEERLIYSKKKKFDSCLTFYINPIFSQCFVEHGHMFKE